MYFLYFIWIVSKRHSIEFMHQQLIGDISEDLYYWFNRIKPGFKFLHSKKKKHTSPFRQMGITSENCTQQNLDKCVAGNRTLTSRVIKSLYNLLSSKFDIQSIKINFNGIYQIFNSQCDSKIKCVFSIVIDIMPFIYYLVFSI